MLSPRRVKDIPKKDNLIRDIQIVTNDEVERVFKDM